MRTIPRRRAALILIGLLHLGMVPGIIVRPVVVDPGLAILHTMMPVWLRASLWATAGLLCLALALHHRSEAVGWGIAMLMPIERAVSYLWSGIQWIIPGWPPGAAASFGTAAVWAVIGGLIWLMAGWPDVQEVAE